MARQMVHLRDLGEMNVAAVVRSGRRLTANALHKKRRAAFNSAISSVSRDGHFEEPVSPCRLAGFFVSGPATRMTPEVGSFVVFGDLLAVVSSKERLIDTH